MLFESRIPKLQEELKKLNGHGCCSHPTEINEHVLLVDDDDMERGPLIRIPMRDKKIQAVIDTGSQYTLVGKEMVDVEKKTDVKLVDVNGNDVELEGEAEWNGIPVVVHSKLAQDVIVGRNIIERCPSWKKLKEEVKELCMSNSVMMMEEELREKAGKLENENERKECLTLLHEFQDVFSSEEMPKSIVTSVEHSIVTTGKPVRTNPYPASQEQKRNINEWVEKLIKTNAIRRSVSPWASPIIFTKKKDGTQRMCVDYRKLNEQTVKDSYPLPRDDDLFEQLGNCTYFSSLDFVGGYWQIPIREEDRYKTAFTCNLGIYEWNVMPFGLSNAPSTFQRFINDLIQTNGMGHCAKAKLDDILIFTRGNFQNHLDELRKMLEILKKTNCKLKFKKCTFFRKSLTHLGMEVSCEGLKPDEDHIKAIKEIRSPQSLKEIRSILGMLNFYRKFISGYAAKLEPVTRLLKKDSQHQWNSDAETALRKILEELTKKPILIFPDFTKEFILQTDASRHGLGAAIFQDQGSGRQPVAFYSRTLTAAEKNYPTAGMEALAIVFGVKKGFQYLHGQKVVIETDHRALAYINSWKMTNSMIARWWLTLQEISQNATIKYIKGTENNTADVLSRLLLVEELNLSRIEQEQKEDSLCKKIKDALYSHKEFPKEVLKVKDKFHLRNNVLCKDSAVVVPKTLKFEVLSKFHNTEEGAHLGFSKAWKKFNNTYFWPRCLKDLRNWISQCPVCQKNKISRKKIPDEIGRLPRAPPWYRIHIDLIGPLATSNDGNKYILTVIDSCSSFAQGFPIPNPSTKETISILNDKIFLQFGCPYEIVTDRGTNFTSKEFRKFCEEREITLTHTTAFNPRANGKVERLNGTLMDLVTPFVDLAGRNWDTKIQNAIFAYNTAPNVTTGLSPYYVIFGHEPITQSDVLLKKNVKNLTLRKYLLDRASKLNTPMETFPQLIEPKFRIGELVLRKNQYRTKEDKTSKFSPKWLGPYKIVNFKNPFAPRIQHLESEETDTVNIRYLKKYNFDPMRTHEERKLDEGGGEEYEETDLPFEPPDESLEEPSSTRIAESRPKRAATSSRLKTPNFMNSEYLMSISQLTF